MKNKYNPLYALPEIYDNYAGALVSACNSLTKDSGISQNAVVKTFSHLTNNNLADNGHPLFGQLFRIARKECVGLMGKDPASRYSSLPPLERVVAELICIRGYSVLVTEKLLNRSSEAIEATLYSINNKLNSQHAVL